MFTALKINIKPKSKVIGVPNIDTSAMIKYLIPDGKNGVQTNVFQVMEASRTDFLHFPIP